MAKRLLVVDDEPNLLRAVEACLRAEGFDVTTARSGREALLEDRADSSRSNRQRHSDAWNEWIRIGSAVARLTPHSLVPVVFLTAKGEMADRIKGFRAGVDAYLTKPFEPDELIAVIKNIVQRVARTQTQIAV